MSGVAFRTAPPTGGSSCYNLSRDDVRGEEWLSWTIEEGEKITNGEEESIEMDGLLSKDDRLTLYDPI